MPVEMKNLAVLIFVLLVSAPSLAIAASPAPGIYRDASGHLLYVGIDEEPPDRLINYFDSQTQTDGAISQTGSLHLQKAVSESRVRINAPHGPLGVSLWYADNRKRAAIILIHGNEAETRDEGFLIPYFVLNGINVISYDQRGTGESAGDWKKSGPIQRAEDVAAIYDTLAANPLVDAARMGVWGFSNGGWTAPIVATKRPIAFMILMSAPAGTIADNIYFELRERMLHDHFDEQEISAATATLRAQIDALAGIGSWDRARTMYEAAVRQKWFADLGMRPHQQFPPANELAESQRRSLLYDPSTILRRVTVPTLALYGALDRRVDSSHDSVLLRSALARAGVRDLTIHIYERAGHSLSVSANGYDEDGLPRQYVRGFPRIMLDWLKQRGFLNATATSATRRAP
jgi:pimeloyl-ACP methyl ester carboxylesterase